MVPRQTRNGILTMTAWSGHLRPQLLPTSMRQFNKLHIVNSSTKSKQAYQLPPSQVSHIPWIWKSSI